MNEESLVKKSKVYIAQQDCLETRDNCKSPLKYTPPKSHKGGLIRFKFELKSPAGDFGGMFRLLQLPR